MEIFDLKDKLEYLDEAVELEYEEWADNKEENKEERICDMFTDRSFCKLILVNENELIGFISLFPNDCEEEKNLTPWYATMYVKEEYRNHGYSSILNDAIIKEAKKRGFSQYYI